MRVVIYARLSRRTEVNALNLVDQLDRCREHATSRGWQVVAEHEDYGESAFDRDAIDDRPGFARVLDMVNASQVDVVLAWRPDRLWRDQVEAAVFFRQCVRHGVQLVATVTEGDRDPANPGDEMVASIVATVGRYESQAKSARLRAKARQLAELGKVGGGGKRPFGYEKDRRTIRPDEAALIRAGAEMLVGGANLSAVARLFQESGIPPAAGGAQWRTVRLRDMYRRPRLAGLRAHNGRVVATAEWPAILTAEQFDAVRAILDDPTRLTRPGAPVSRSLLAGGIAVCGACDGPLTYHKNHDKRAYRCAKSVNTTGCGKVVRQAEPVEEVVAEYLFAAIDDGVFLDEPTPLQPVVSLAEVQQLRERLERLSQDYYTHGLIGRDEYFAARRPLAARLDQVTSKPAAPVRHAKRDLSRLRADWPDMGFEERRAVLVDLVERVVIHPAVRGRTVFDPTLVDVPKFRR